MKKILQKLLCGNIKRLHNTILKNKVISFDLFDTLISRQCITPTEIFNIVEKQFNQKYTDNLKSFCQNRINAEKEARINSCNEEITLDEIYRNLGRFYDSTKCHLLKELEIKAEIDQSHIREDFIELYSQCLINKKTVFITSDMYLSKSTILKILEKNNIPFPNKLYLSSEKNKTKKNGTLFQLILKENQLEPNLVLHIGDNFKSDFISPRKLNINAFWINKE